jgi:peptide/nickel transport system permease protein
MNLSKFHIIFRELMPNIASYIVINFILIMKNAITGSVGIMFLGLAAFEPTNWGAILITAKDFGALFIPSARLWLISPIMCIFIFQFGIILLSSGLDESLNPRLRRS